MDRPLHLPTGWTGQHADRARSSLLVLATHAALLAMMLLGGIVQQMARPDMAAEPTPAMITLPGPAAMPALPAPPATNIAIASPAMPAPVIAIAPAIPAPAEAPPVQAEPSAAQNTMTASIAPPGAGTQSAGAGTSAQGAAAGGAGAVDLSAYLARVSRHIEGYLGQTARRDLRVPLPAKFQLRLYLHWRHDGTVLEMRLARSSGSTSANLATMRAVRLSQPLPPIPPEFQLNEISGELPISMEIDIYNSR